MVQNFYNKISWLEWLFSDKDDRARLRYNKNVYKTILADLKEIERNDENNVDSISKDTEYYNIIIKGRHTKTWRAYFLNSEYPMVVFPIPNGGVWIQELEGGDYYHVNGMEPSQRSVFWIPSFSFNYYTITDLEVESNKKRFVASWVKRHTDYDLTMKGAWTSNVYCKLKKEQ